MKAPRSGLEPPRLYICFELTLSSHVLHILECLRFFKTVTCGQGVAVFCVDVFPPFPLVPPPQAGIDLLIR